MTFTIPEFALNVTLQDDRYLQCVDGLTDMLERYYKVSSLASASVTSATVLILQLPLKPFTAACIAALVPANVTDSMYIWDNCMCSLEPQT